MNTQRLLLTERPSQDLYLTLSFGAGLVRYLKLLDMRTSNSSQLQIEVSEHRAAPDRSLKVLDWGGAPTVQKAICLLGGSSNRSLPFAFRDVVFQPSHFCKGVRNLTKACAVFEQVIEQLLAAPFPSNCYRTFSNLLQLEDLRLREFRESWCAEAYFNYDVFRTYIGNSNYHTIVISGEKTNWPEMLVFKKTEFYRNRLAEIEQKRENTIANLDRMSLAASGYHTFVYLMEDLRNNSLKIGKSKHPKKREKTLQSEVPEVHLRFAIPCDESLEVELHRKFAAKRKRGEGCVLDETECLELIMKLTSAGDISRAFADTDWIGKVFLKSCASTRSVLTENLKNSAMVQDPPEVNAEFESQLKALTLLGNSMLKLKNFCVAIQNFDAAIKLAPNRSMLYVRRGLAKRITNDYEGAMSDFDKALELDPKSAVAITNRANLKQTLGLYAASLIDYDTAVRLAPNNAKTLCRRGWTKHQLSEYVSAIIDYDDAIRLDPNHAKAYHCRAVTNTATKCYAAAINDFNHAIRLAPNDVDTYVTRGWTQLKLKDYVSAINDFDQAIRLDPKQTIAINNKAFLLAVIDIADIRNPTEALRLVEEVLVTDTNNAYALNAKSCALAAIGDFRAAIAIQTSIDNIAWQEDDDIDGGGYTRARIAAWESSVLWYPQW